MTVTAFSEPAPSPHQFELQSAQTLQELHNVSETIMEQYDINHALLLCMPTPEHSLTLPLLPIEPELHRLLNKTVHTNTHPAVATNNQFGKPRALSDFATSVGNETILTELMTAFRNAGMRQVYELPLHPRKHIRFILELARIDQPISGSELTELQSLVSIIPQKLPNFLVDPPHGTVAEADLHVR